MQKDQLTLAAFTMVPPNQDSTFKGPNSKLQLGTMVIGDPVASLCFHSDNQSTLLSLPDAMNSISFIKYNGDVYGHGPGLRCSVFKVHQETSPKAATDRQTTMVTYWEEFNHTRGALHMFLAVAT